MERILIFSGSGLSAGAGLATFRGPGGLWRERDPFSLATPEAWRSDPHLVTDFYNERRAQAHGVEPTAAHRALARLGNRFETTVVTQNVDDLHERAGSHRVLHLHGVIDRVRSTRDATLTRWMDGGPVSLDETAPDGGIWRPDVVWFGEMVHQLDAAIEAVAAADRVLVVGTSLTVQPAASLLAYAAEGADKCIVNAEPVPTEPGFELILGEADAIVPDLVADWLDKA